MIREAKAGDEHRIDAFLEPRTETSMFLRGNLARYGLFDRDHPHGTCYFLWDEGGQIRAVFGCTNGGYMMCQAPDAPDEIWTYFARALTGKTIWGMTGEARQVERTLTALAIPDEEFALNHIEPLYRLSLDTAPCPGMAALRPATQADHALLVEWFRGYVRDTEPTRDAGDIARQALANADRAATMIDTRFLIEHGKPRAMTAINTRVDDTVQVSGVYVPPAFRGKGRGGLVVAAHLAVLKASMGIQHAILFAQNPRAARAYESIGFRRIGDVRVARLHRPRRQPEPTMPGALQ